MRARAAQLEQLVGVTSVTLNPICGTLRVCYDGANISASEVRRCWTRDGLDAGSRRCAERAADGWRWVPLIALAMRALLAHARG